MHCNQPPKIKPPCPHVRKVRAIVRPAPKSVLTPKTSDNSVMTQGTATATTQTVVINVVPVPTKTETFTVPAPQVVTKVVVKREVRTVTRVERKPFHLFVMAGMGPTQHRVSSTDCDVVRQQCQVDVRRKYVVDFGVGGSVSSVSGVSVGLVGTVQGNVYGTLGFNF